MSRRRILARTRSLLPRPLVVVLLLLLGGLALAVGVEPVQDELVAQSATSPSSMTADAPPQKPAAPPNASSTSEPSPARSERLTVVAGGDVSFGRATARRILRDSSYRPLGGVERLLVEADLAFINLESVLSDRHTPRPDNPLIFCGPRTAVSLLESVGIDIVSLANNHAWDCGYSGLSGTLDLLASAGIAAVGASRNPGRAHWPTVVDVSGWSVAWLAVTDIWNHGPLATHTARDHVAGADAERLVEQVRDARRRHDLVLVSYHGGSEYVPYPLQRTRKLFRQVAAAGADAIFGHHPHIPHGVGWHESRPLFYSLGNLVFPSHRDHPWTRVGFLASLTFRAHQAPIVRACPYRIHNAAPDLFNDAQDDFQRERFVRHLRWLSVTVGGTALRQEGPGGCVELTPPPPRLSAQSQGTAEPLRKSTCSGCGQ